MTAFSCWISTISAFIYGVGGMYFHVPSRILLHDIGHQAQRLQFLTPSINTWRESSDVNKEKTMNNYSSTSSLISFHCSWNWSVISPLISLFVLRIFLPFPSLWFANVLLTSFPISNLVLSFSEFALQCLFDFLPLVSHLLFHGLHHSQNLFKVNIYFAFLIFRYIAYPYMLLYIKIILFVSWQNQ